MPIEDAFAAFDAGAAANEVATTVTEPAVVKSEAVADGEGKIVLTFKEGGGYDASWVVIHAASVQDGLAILNDESLGKLLSRTKVVAAHFKGGGSQPAAQAAPANNAPPASQQAPGGEKRFCAHGEMQFKSGISKAGKAYSLFSCTAPRNEQCPAQWPDKK